MQSAQNPQIRQLACVYLRKIICNLWVQLQPNDQAQAKQLLLTQYINEPVTAVKRAISNVIGSLSKLLIPNKEWPELFQFVFEFCGAAELVKKELAMMLLSVIIEYFSVNEINTYYESLNPIIESYLQSSEPSLKRLAVETVNNLTQAQNAIKILKKYSNLIPLVLNALSLDDEDMIQKVFETLTDFLEAKKVMQPHLEIVVQAAISVSKNTNLSFNVRESTIYFLENFGDNFGKYMAKKQMTNMLQQIVETGFIIASESTEEYADDEDSPHSLALYMLYNYASEVPNNVVYPIFK